VNYPITAICTTLCDHLASALDTKALFSVSCFPFPQPILTHAVPITTAWGYGDPHVNTLDGLTYTFNGLGEYYLMKTTDDAFTLQARTQQAIDSQTGQATYATIYTGFAAAAGPLTDTLTVLSNADRTGNPR
jgi:hypothetical protein